MTTRRSAGPAAAIRGQAGAAHPASSHTCSTRTSSSRPTAYRSVSRFHREHPYEAHAGGMDYRPRLRARRIARRRSSEETRTRADDLVPDQLPHHRIAAALSPLLRRRLPRRVPDRLRPVDDAPRGRHASSRAASRGSSTPDASGRRPVAGAYEVFHSDSHWKDLLILFHEYFHGDSGAGLGASHQTGWTGLIAKLLDTLGETAGR